MSNSPEPELDLDLHFLPAWAQESPSFNRYAKFEGGAEERPERRGGKPDRPHDRRDRLPRREGERGRGEGPGKPDHGRPRRDDRGSGRPQAGRFEPPKTVAPPPQFAVALLPEEKGVESLAKQIKLTGRAYPLFDIGRLMLRPLEQFRVLAVERVRLVDDGLVRGDVVLGAVDGADGGLRCDVLHSVPPVWLSGFPAGAATGRPDTIRAAPAGRFGAR